MVAATERDQRFASSDQLSGSCVAARTSVSRAQCATRGRRYVFRTPAVPANVSVGPLGRVASRWGELPLAGGAANPTPKFEVSGGHVVRPVVLDAVVDLARPWPVWLTGSLADWLTGSPYAEAGRSGAWQAHRSGLAGSRTG